jgi:hypothetical protein
LSLGFKTSTIVMPLIEENIDFGFAGEQYGAITIFHKSKVLKLRMSKFKYESTATSFSLKAFFLS